MRYVLAAIFICAAGMPAASALPTVSPNSVSVSKADPRVQVVRRPIDRTLIVTVAVGTASTLWSEAVTTKSEEKP
jgi:hypothetical protein